MTRTFITIAALSALASQPAAAGDDFAEYGVNLGVSPFGFAFNGTYNTSKKTSLTAALGGAPKGKAPCGPGPSLYQEWQTLCRLSESIGRAEKEDSVN